jgi:hypothetical protein
MELRGNKCAISVQVLPGAHPRRDVRQVFERDFEHALDFWRLMCVEGHQPVVPIHSHLAEGSVGTVAMRFQRIYSFARQR